MNKTLFAAGAALSALLFTPSAVAAQDQWPVEPAEYVEVSAIHIDDGYELKYANHLANTWRKSMDFRVEKGWIEGYEILSNIHARAGEPDLYLLTRFTKVVSPEEGRARAEEWRAFNEATTEEMQEASAGRAEYRTLGSTMMLRRLVWDD